MDPNVYSAVLEILDNEHLREFHLHWPFESQYIDRQLRLHSTDVHIPQEMIPALR